MFLRANPLLSLCVTTTLWGVVYAVVDDVAVDAVINAGMGCHQTPGLAVAVVKNGNVLMSKGFGVSNIAAATPVTNSTLFGIASLSKAFTTTLLSKILKERTRFSINTNVYKILGRYKFNNTLRSVYATVEDLMAHRMGIPRNNYIRLDDTLTRENLLSRVKYLKNVGGFRDSFAYNDLMYGLLTRITEAVTGNVWEDNIIEHIFTPLRMDTSTFGTRVDFSSPNVATPYVTENGQTVEASPQFLRHWAMLGGSGSVVSSADDMAKWMLFHLRGGKNREGRQVVAEDLLKETYKPRNTLSTNTINTYFSKPKTPVTMSNDGYGLGWKSGYYRGLPMVQHSGSTFGYRSFLTLIPDKNLGVFVTMTGTDPNYWFRGSLSAYLMDVYLGRTPWINTTTICSFPDPWGTRRRSRPLRRRTTVTRHQANLALPAYTGTFRNEAYGNMIIRYESESHRLKAAYGIGSWVLTSRGNDTFRANWNNPAPTLDFDFQFLTSNEEVYAVLPSFEKTSPQIFFRIGNGQTAMPINGPVGDSCGQRSLQSQVDVKGLLAIICVFANPYLGLESNMTLRSSHLFILWVTALWGVVYAVVDDVAVDAVINAGLKCHQTPGLAVAVVKDGHVVMSRGYGYSDAFAKTPVTNTTMFQIASLSKAFTTTLLSKVLRDQSSFSINTNVYKILGRYKFNNTLLSVYATVEDLMAHRMGIPRNNYIRLDDTLTRENLLSRVKYLPSVGGFRDSFYYSDLMYGLLTHITEFLTKKAWEDSMTDIIFKPLRMDSSTFGTRVDYSAPNMATPYYEQSSKLVVASPQFIRYVGDNSLISFSNSHWAMLGGSGSVVSSADDMAKWMLFHLSGGKNREGNQVVAEDLLKETYKPRNAISGGSINTYFSRPKTPVTMSNDGYGLGWKSGYYRGLPMVQHSGSTFGYRSFLTLIPDKNLGVFVTMTGTDPNYWFRGSLSAYLMDVYLGEAPWLNTTTICSFPDPLGTPSTRRRSRTRKGYGRRLARRKRAISHTANLALQAYIGTFKHEAYGNIIIHYDSASQELKATYGIASWVLTSRGGDTFRATWDKPAPVLNFNFNFKTSSGHAYALIPSFEHSSPPVFYRASGSDPIIG
ncbi:uncharacterized protein [Haliotis asinina]|uniref:uncharacterized protein n=1 Tax=Haliotis asinina TaxID=109174 RepID=UPI003531FDA4